MIKELRQAEAIQARRVADGKKGLSRAVRRFLWKQVKAKTNKKDWYAYNELKQSLPQHPIHEANGNV